MDTQQTLLAIAVPMVTGVFGYLGARLAMRGQIQKTLITSQASLEKDRIDAAAQAAAKVAAEAALVAAKTASSAAAAAAEALMASAKREESIWNRAEKQRNELQVQVTEQQELITKLQQSFANLSGEVKVLRLHGDEMETDRLRDSHEIKGLKDEIAMLRKEIVRLTDLLQRSTSIILQAGGSPPALETVKGDGNAS